MGLDILLIGYNGQTLESIADPKNLLHRVLPPADEESDSLLAKIDWYGDTFFNYLQMKRFLEEWDSLNDQAQTPEEGSLLGTVRRFAVQCQKERHMLRFIGD